MIAQNNHQAKRLSTKVNKLKYYNRIATAPNTPKRGVRILALDGGGMRGLSELTILSHIAKKLYGDNGPESTKVCLCKSREECNYYCNATFD